MHIDDVSRRGYALWRALKSTGSAIAPTAKTRTRDEAKKLANMVIMSIVDV